MPASESQQPPKPRKSKKVATQQSLDKQIWSICDVLRRSKCSSALQYVPELTWILFLRILDEREQREQQEAQALGIPFTPSIEPPYRWRDWAAPDGSTRKELTDGAPGAYFGFVNGRPNAQGEFTGLLPYLRGLKNKPHATPRQKVISEVLTGVERTRVDTERNFLDVLDKVHAISLESVDTTHIFPLSQVYEGLLLKLGEKKNDGGQFYTPREVIRAMVRVIDPRLGKTAPVIYDPCCGTGAFLAQAYEYMRDHLGDDVTAEQLQTLKERVFWGREKDDIAYPIALANLILHGIDKPNLWHGNTLTGNETYGGLFEDAPAQYDVILTNPPFGGKEGKDAQTNFDYKATATQVLFLQHIMRSLKDGGRCGIVLDEGVLFQTDNEAFVKTKRKLLDDCDVWCIVSLPSGVFAASGGAVKTDLVFFAKGRPTSKIWYYDLSDLKVRKKAPLTLKHFEGFFDLMPSRAESDSSWTVDIVARKAAASAEAEPLLAQAAIQEAEAEHAKQTLADLKKASPKDEAAIEAIEAELRGDEGRSRPAGKGAGDAQRRLRPEGGEPAQEAGD